MNLITEEEIGEEYPFNNFIFINDNSLSLNYKNDFEGINKSFIDCYNIKDIKEELFKENIDYEISLYNNLSKSQILDAGPNKKCSLIIPKFSYNPFVLENSNYYPKNNVKDILSIFDIEFFDESVYDNINDCRATFAKKG